MKKEVYFQWLIKSVPNASVVALAQAAALQAASKKTVAYTLSTLLNVSTVVLVQVTALQALSKLNNSVLKKGESFWLTFFPFQKETKSPALTKGSAGLFYVHNHFCSCRLMTTTEESTSTMPVSFHMETLSWNTMIPKIAATTGSMVAVTDALDAGRPLSPFV